MGIIKAPPKLVPHFDVRPQLPQPEPDFIHLDTTSKPGSPPGKVWTCADHWKIKIPVKEQIVHARAFTCFPLYVLGLSPWTYQGKHWFSALHVRRRLRYLHKKRGVPTAGIQEALTLIRHQKFVPDEMEQLRKPPIMNGIGTPENGTPIVLCPRNEFTKKDDGRRVFIFMYVRPNGWWGWDRLPIDHAIPAESWFMTWRNEPLRQ